MKYNSKRSKFRRRTSALERLEANRKSNFKSNKSGTYPVADEDRARMDKEIQILKSRV